MKLRRGSLLAALLALVGACTEVTRTAHAPDAPTLAELEGDYSAVWVGDGRVLGVAMVRGDAVTFAPYPCRPVGSLDTIGGSLVSYDPGTGEVLAEGKSLDGFVAFELAGRFTRTGLRATYSVAILGVPCDRGELTLVRAP